MSRGGGGGFSILTEEALDGPAPAPSSKPKWIKVVVIWAVALGVLSAMIAGSAVLVFRGETEGKNPCLTSDPYRLPTNVIPSAYRLDIRTWIPYNFTGSVDIDIQATESTNCVVLNAQDMTIQDVSLQVDGKKRIPTIWHNNTIGQLYLHFGDGLSSGTSGTLSLSFSSDLRDDMAGYYRSHYTQAGEQRWLAATQFEHMDARRAFPCFDEINMKATFQLTLSAYDPDSQFVFLNNMPAKGQPAMQENGYRRIEFGTTPKMSTYLVAFIVGDLRSLEYQDPDLGVTFAVWSIPDKVEDLAFALEVAPKVTKVLGDYLKIPYSSFMPKMDLVAIPDFSAGAMENWGLLTFRDRALLYNPDTSNVLQREYVALVVAHEIVHQWFGDLITPFWWSNLWLKEGFATYFSYFAVDQVYPSWNVWDAFFTDELVDALRDNASPLARTHLAPLAKPADVSNLYDSISYNRGGAMLRMIRSYLDTFSTKDLFRDALSNYLKQFSYGSPSTDDLWTAFATTSGVTSFVENMNLWMDQPGYPVLSVTYQNDQRNVIQLEQSRFLLFQYTKKQEEKDKEADGEKKAESVRPRADAEPVVDPPPQWWIPVSFRAKDQNALHEGHTSFSQIRSEFIRVADGDVAWMKLNNGEHGFYRVNYPISMWLLLGELGTQNNPDFDTGDRFGIVSDIFALSQSGLQETTLALDVCQNILEFEITHPVWVAALDGFGYISNRLYEAPYYSAFQTEVLNMVLPRAEALGWTPVLDEDYEDTKLRPLVLSSAIAYGDENLLAQAVELYKLYDANETQNFLAPDIRDVVYVAYVRNGGLDEWENMFERLKRATDAPELYRCARALASSLRLDLISRTLHLLFTKYIRQQDARSIIYYVTYNPNGRHLAWDFVRENWEWCKETFGLGRGLGNVIRRVTEDMNIEAEREDVLSFFKRVGIPEGAETVVEESVARIEANIAWLKRNKQVLESRYAASLA